MIVSFSSASQGALDAQGTASQPVVFTSNQATPTAGYWQGLIFRQSDHTSTMSYCRVQYAGSYSASAISIQSGEPNISHTVFENNNAYDLTYTGTVSGTVSNCTLNNGVSLLATSSANFTGNTFNWNNSYPVKTYADNVGSLVTGNTYNDQESAYILVTSGNITKDAVWTSAVPIHFANYTIIQGTDGEDGITTLTLDPGTEVRFALNKYLLVGYSSTVQGALNAQGTAAEPVVFTSNQTSPTPGYWQGIIFRQSDHTSTMSYCRVQYAGYSSASAIFIQSASPDISDTVFENNKAYDLTYSGTVGGTVSNCTFNNGVSLLATSSANFTGNNFNWNNSYPVKTYADNVHSLVNGNTYINLTPESYLTVSSGNVTKDAVWTARIPYFMANNFYVQGDDGTDNLNVVQ